MVKADPRIRIWKIPGETPQGLFVIQTHRKGSSGDITQK